jgi:BASS family bile acid:Na+ symporter
LECGDLSPLCFRCDLSQRLVFGTAASSRREEKAVTSHRTPKLLLMELLQKATTVVTLVFILSSMLGMGLGLTVSQIITPLRNLRLVALSLLANFVLMPLTALGLAALLRLDPPLGVGLLLLGTAAGAPFLPKLAQLAKGSLAFSVGLMSLLMVVTVVYLPLVLPLLLPGVSVNPVKIASSLFLFMLLPLALGLAAKAWFAVVASRIKPVLDKVSNLSLILLVLLMIATNIKNVLAVFGTGGILAGLLLIAVGLGAGWLLGGPGMDTRTVLALGTAQRNIAAALVVGGQSFSDPKVVVMVIVVAIVGLLILMPLSKALGRRTPVPAESP